MTNRTSFVREFWFFVKARKVYWMIPIILALLLVILLVTVGSTSPFIYTLF